MNATRIRPRPNTLSERDERKILRLIEKGLTHRDIAARLGLSPATVSRVRNRWTFARPRVMP